MEEILNEINKEIKPNGGYKMHSYQDVKANYLTYIHNEDSIKLIDDAYAFVEKKHAGIFRKSGEPYIHHLLEVAYILTTLQCGPITIASGLLHDVVEDTDTTIDDINRLFGPECAQIVDALTKIQRLKLSHRTQEEFEAEDRRKIFLGMAKDIRVILIKLADRLHNMRTVEALKPERQQALAKETLDVFAPIAHRIGVYRIESELEDLSLKIQEPQKYNEILDLLNNKIKNRGKALETLKKKIADIILKNNINFEIESRVKSIYSIYKKMYLKGHSFDEIYDVLALRVITETEINCYEILGLIHAQFKPIPGRFKDYIAVPKPNMYQSLHTSIIAGDGNIFEVQIRTKEMDEVAEIGIAAHWRYKEGEKYNPKKEQQEIEEKLHWFRDFVSISSESSDETAQEYMKHLSKDIFEANVYVFTPKGRVIDLPAGSTPLDFAYRIHTKVGEQAVGAIVNNMLVPLNTVLKTGDVVDIKTSKTSTGPNEGWLNIVKTNSAKSRIKKFLQKKNNDLLRDDKISKGKQSCVDFFKDRGVDEKEMENLLSTENVLKNYHFDNLEELFIGVSNHNPNPALICDFLGIKRKEIQNLNLSKKVEINNDNCPVYVKGTGSGLKISLGNCCTPIPGDTIVGYVTKGMGITVHRAACPNLKNAKSRLIDVHWKDNLGIADYPVDIQLECNDRPNLLADILSTLSSNKIKVTELNAKLHPENLTCTVYCQIYVPDLNTLNKIFQTLKNVHDIYEVKRRVH